MPQKPALILIAAAILPAAASEAGKGFAWALALSRIYSLHIVTSHPDAEATAAAGIPDATFHPVGGGDSWVSRWRSYLQYAQWCRQIVPVCAELIRNQRAIGLHHVTFGSFRFLPRYDRLGIPYTLGPLGGGEGVGIRLLLQSGLPRTVLLQEAARSPLNEAIRLKPDTRRVIRDATGVLSTTRETAALLAKIGAKRQEVVFPDALPVAPDADRVMEDRRLQASRLGAEFRCVFSGRAAWWKGPQLAIRLIARLRARGLHCTLVLHSEGAAIPQLRRLSAELGSGDAVLFPGYASREGLAQAYRQSHVFLLPSMHESSSSALLEGFATGLPSITLGVGGTATIATGATGLNEPVEDIEAWYEQGCATIERWVADPLAWLACCRAAVDRAQQFTFDGLAETVADVLRPERYQKRA
jgi:glycosyltransferase involved in cell wall biosynthesis